MSSSSLSLPFLKHKLSREVSELYLAVMILNLANSMVSVFAPIYLYNSGFSIQRIVLFYFLLQLFYFFLMPLGGKIAVRKGFEHTIAYSIPFVILFLVALNFTDRFEILFYIAPLLGAIARALFWPAYHADMAYYGNHKQRGSEISLIRILALLSTVVGPLAGGLILKYSNFGVLIVAFSVVAFASVIPLFSTREEFKVGNFSYWYAFKELFLRGTLKKMVGLLGYGEQWVLITLWPLFIFIVIKTYFATGLLIAATTLITTVLVFWIGKLVDRQNEKAVIKISAVFHFFIWVSRIFLFTPIFVFFSDLFAKVLRNAVDVPVFSLIYKRAKRTDNFMKTIVATDLGINFGKLIVAFIVLIIFMFTDNIVFAFIPAAIASLLYLLI